MEQLVQLEDYLKLRILQISKEITNDIIMKHINDFRVLELERVLRIVQSMIQSYE